MRLPNLERHMKKVEEFAKELPAEMHKKFQEETPIRTGNAKRKTKQTGNKVVGDYPYASRLNEGYSRQAPNGMTNPTVDYVRDQLRRLA